MLKRKPSNVSEKEKHQKPKVWWFHPYSYKTKLFNRMHTEIHGFYLPIKINSTIWLKISWQIWEKLNQTLAVKWYLTIIVYVILSYRAYLIIYNCNWTLSSYCQLHGNHFGDLCLKDWYYEIFVYILNDYKVAKSI